MGNNSKVKQNYLYKYIYESDLKIKVGLLMGEGDNNLKVIRRQSRDLKIINWYREFLEYSYQNLRKIGL